MYMYTLDNAIEPEIFTRRIYQFHHPLSLRKISVHEFFSNYIEHNIMVTFTVLAKLNSTKGS